MSERKLTKERTLRSQYFSEYNSWRAMKKRAEEGRAKINPRFQEFEMFLDIVGPKSSATETLDRINPSDPEYGPGKVRWASKALQSRNRKNTTFLAYSGAKYPDFAGRRLTLIEWAELTGQPESSLRRRRASGWSDNEIIEGSRTTDQKPLTAMSREALIAFQPWPEDRRVKYEAAFRKLRNPGEDRFEFWLNAILERRFTELRRLARGVAYFLRDDLELEAHERSVHEPEHKCWAKHPRASLAQWREHVERDRGWRRERAKVRKLHAEWKAALQTADAKRNDVARARAIQRELADRYLSADGPKRTTRQEPIEVEWAARRDDYGDGDD